MECKGCAGIFQTKDEELDPEGLCAHCDIQATIEADVAYAYEMDERA